MNKPMQYKIQVKYAPPTKMAKHFKLSVDSETGLISFTKDEGTLFFDKATVDGILMDAFQNRNQYQQMVEGSNFVELQVFQGKGHCGVYGDSVTIKF